MDSLDGRGIWRTIDSAPKDGTAVMVVWQDLDGREHQGACWNNGTGWYPFNRTATYWHPLQPLPSTSPQPAPSSNLQKMQTAPSDGKEDGSSGAGVRCTVPLPVQTDRPCALKEIAAERRRQVEVEGWTAAHDDEHAHGELASAAAVYAYDPDRTDEIFHSWPWDSSWWKPTTRRRDLVKAAALIVAEIERLDRAQSSEAQPECSERSSDPTLSGTDNKTSDGWMQEVVEVLEPFVEPLADLDDLPEHLRAEDDMPIGTALREAEQPTVGNLRAAASLLHRLRGASHG